MNQNNGHSSNFKNHDPSKRTPMNSRNFNDEALTRLLLDEVDATERAALEATLERDPTARRAYEERREAIELLRSAAAVAEAPRLSNDRRGEIFAAADGVSGGSLAATSTASSKNTAAPITPVPPTARQPGWYSYSGIAAAFLLFAVGYCFYPAVDETSVDFVGGEQVRRDDSDSSSSFSQPKSLSISGEATKGTGSATFTVDMTNITPVEGAVTALTFDNNLVTVSGTRDAPKISETIQIRAHASRFAVGEERDKKESPAPRVPGEMDLRSHGAGGHQETLEESQRAAALIAGEGGHSSTPLTPITPPVPDPGVTALRKFPQLGGDLLSVQEGFVVINAGTTQDVTEGAFFDVVEGERVIARLRVLRAHGDLAACEVVSIEDGAQIQPNLKFRAVPDIVAMGYADGLKKAVEAQLERQMQAMRRELEERLQAMLESCNRLPQETPGQMYFRFWGDNPFVRADLDPLSTFGVDVDTASHAIVRNYLRQGQLPPRAAVRTEEFVNAYPSRLPPPTEQDLAVYLELAPSELSHRDGVALMKVGVKAREVSEADRKSIALTFVIDVSGSMGGGGRLELVKQAILTLLPELNARDTIGIVAFSTTGRIVLEPVSALDVDAIGAALMSLSPDGSTNAQEGLDLGYAMAERQFRPHASNRVALFSDGVANTGITDLEGLLGRTADARARGIDFNSFGVGMGNHNDALLEQLADRGDGICVYLDTLKEAQKYFRTQLAGTFQTVARDAKIQVEFHPAAVVSYRQIGYENRAIADKDFRNDAIDAGEVGAGHEVVALYEVELRPNHDGPIATARVRYRSADHDEVVEIEKQATSSMLNGFLATSDHFRLSAAVAAFAEVLRDSTWARGTTLSEIEEVARSLTHLDQEGDTSVAELVAMIDEAKGLVAKRVLSDLDRLLDEVKRNRHLRARIEDHIGEQAQSSGAVKTAAPRALGEELDRLRAQHDELEQRLRKLLVG